jgi:integrase
VRLYRRGKAWWAWGYDAGGRRWRRSTRQTDRRAAERVAAQLERDRTGEAYRAEKAALGDALAALLFADERADRSDATIEKHTTHGRHLIRILGSSVDLRGLDAAATARYADARLAEGASRHTAHMEISTLRRACAVAGVTWRRDFMPDLGRYYRPRETWLTPAQVDRLCAALPPRHAAEVRLITQTGMRSGELAALAWEHVDLPGGRVRVPGTKTVAARRTLPLSAGARAAFASLGPGTGPVFGPWPNMHRDLRAAAKRAGVPAVSANDLRRTFASWLAQAGVSSLVTATLLGHTSTRMVEQVYSRLSAESLAVAVTALPRCDAYVSAPVATVAKPAKKRTSRAVKKEPRNEKSRKKPGK